MSLPYHEPNIISILSLTSLIIILNASRCLLDHFLYCGLLGEIVVGFVWGLWLNQSIQQTIQSLGYLGLIALVFEGGLGLSSSQLKSTVGTSATVATIGLTLPISLSFLLLKFPFTVEGAVEYPEPLAAFSAGASLCSTSLGTTLAILSAAGVQRTKVGTVLMSAAMMDDVVGLIMVRIVAGLGSGHLTPWTVARPVVVSIILLLATIIITHWILIPCWTALHLWFHKRSDSSESKSRVEEWLDQSKSAVCDLPHLGFVLATLILIAFLVVSAFVDASTLFAAFLAGCVIKATWKDALDTSRNHTGSSPAIEMYETYYSSITSHILAPFFFASIGFAIPIREMFVGSIVWKGLLYTLLMIFAKAAVGIAIYAELWLNMLRRRQRAPNRRSQEPAKRPQHLAALIISLAMVARGEIGFLIASLASSSGTLTTQKGYPTPGEPGYKNQEVFLVITWAIFLCTLVGPVGVGFVVRKLQKECRRQHGVSHAEAQRNILGSWA